MKKFIALIMVFLLCAAVPSVGFAQNESDIKILCLGKYLEPDVAPFNANSRIMAPVRAVFEAVGAEVVWDDALKKATAKKGNDEVSLTLGSNIITVNGESIVMDTVLTERDSRVFAPIRFVAESFGYKVSYHDESRTAVISETTQYEFYSSLSVALPEFHSVTGAEFIRREKNESGYDEFYYTYNENYTTDYFNALQADFGYVLSNIYFENGAHIYEYYAANNHIVKVTDYFNSDGMICITVTPNSQQEFSVINTPYSPEPSGGPDLQLPDMNSPPQQAAPNENKLDYSSVTGAALIESHTMDDGNVIHRYAYNQYAHMVYESFLLSQGWHFYDFDFDIDSYSNTTYYTDGSNLIAVSVMYMFNEVWVVYPY